MVYELNPLNYIDYYNNMSKSNARRLLHQLVTSCIKLNNNYKHTQKLQLQCQQLNIQQILKLIDFRELGIQRDHSNIMEGLGICNIYEHQPLRISVYYLPQGQTMKLHDHSGMEVLSYICSGTMQAKIFTHLQGNIYKRKVVTLKKGQFSFIDGLQGNQENLHQFYALEPSYFLDIIFPDYDASRVCRFFEEEQSLEGEKVRLREVADYDVQFAAIL